mmetsp:Transcript_12698/g.27582  ORF Transcript_12698/g.27582 Transcript_12698/m.27582 type:complete len:208 (-) Transcript_12698:1206-1829(-)
MTLTLCGDFSRSIAISILAIKADRFAPPHLLHKLNPCIHNLNLGLVPIPLSLPLALNHRTRSTNGVIINIFRPIPILPLALYTDSIHTIALVGQFQKILLPHLSMIVGNLGARAVILLTPLPQTSMNMIFMIRILHHFVLHQFPSFFKLDIGHGFKLVRVPHILKSHDVPARGLNRTARALGHDFPGQNGGGPASAKIAQCQNGHEA